MDKHSSTVRRVTLEFQDWGELPGIESPIRHDISAIGAIGSSIFVACDETASVERLTAGGDAKYSAHKHFALGEIFDLPDGPRGEMDIEGLDVDDGYLWITGSHSLKRDRPERDKHGAKLSLRRMLEIDRDPNRYFIGCVPVAPTNGETVSLAKKVGKREAACIRLRKNKSRLLKWRSI